MKKSYRGSETGDARTEGEEFNILWTTTEETTISKTVTKMTTKRLIPFELDCEAGCSIQS